jgi:hypothetical protein
MVNYFILLIILSFINNLNKGEPLDLYIYRNKRLNENKIKLFTRQTVGIYK